MVKAIYGVEDTSRILTYGEYKQLVASTNDIYVNFRPTNSILQRNLSKLKNPSEADITKLGIKDDTRVYAYRKDSDGKIYTEQIKQIRRNKGSLQMALISIASGNKNLGITVTQQRYDKAARERSGITYRTSKPVFSVSSPYTNYKAIRELLDSNLLPFVPEINRANEEGNFNIEYYNEETGDRESIRMIEDAAGNVTGFKALKYRDRLHIIDGIVENIEDFGNKYFSMSLEEAKALRDRLYEEVEKLENQETVPPLKMEDLEQILQTDENGTHTNVYIPLFRYSPPGFAKSQIGINQLGTNLDNSNAREALEQTLTTSFESITPTRISVQVPKVSVPQVVTPPEQVLPAKAKDILDPNNFSHKVTLESLIPRIDTLVEEKLPELKVV